MQIFLMTKLSKSIYLFIMYPSDACVIDGEVLNKNSHISIKE